MTVRATAPAATPAEERASALLRRQLLLTALGVGLIVLMMAFAKSQEVPQAADPVAQYLQAHQPPNPGNARLAYVQLGVAGVVAVIALGHAAHVVAFVFRRKVV